ncbi:hypothetical protein GCM10007989_15810 [Devosia pacifica]|uniref:Uncharacterized protein n=1 Tax=Devosia pacifica TaxID=1335967 RepID=A0A918VSP5_9HYPH|nr:hypothetical protein [Devosia pacifica]GHA21329.1 hypothetical protein GCM10007989_15810 [Devosia pacifica]
MIGSFAYDTSPSAGDIVVQLAWHEGERVASLAIPSKLEPALRQAEYPKLDQHAAIESVLSVGLFIAIRSNRRLTISGDCSAWCQKWGSLRSRDLTHEFVC